MSEVLEVDFNMIKAAISPFDELMDFLEDMEFVDPEVVLMDFWLSEPETSVLLDMFTMTIRYVLRI
ncbi:hypothetical protein COU14_00685 [Candidatus Kaiserbacteria bacterium CG10_big_fil_rev_8_21_14_0_10_44_10]|uniref:Uncharacterized protein n=1 Tax=Candidatus Kaiserbacteria bacterium CG10_big_fil_rev_8_21_14_0_10_44_10 TaxID=1974606 RepID=A0A2H0UI86_9BACT|nr:MAG: hypothetical protein COU14_00685 [Candidatus Kaiserbacteria bacterium CG10_big_fil_rev_8_21_14_0_10_44_10]